MGCEASSIKEKEGTQAAAKISKPYSSNANAGPQNASSSEITEKVPPARDMENLLNKDPLKMEVPCTSDSLIAFVPVTCAVDTNQKPPATNTDLNHSGSTNEDLNGSLCVDLSGSFRMLNSNKGDIVLNTKVPEGRRSRSVSSVLLMTVSPHPSDDDIVLICVDCGMEISEHCESVLCPLTGRVHV
ncbi:unspecified product [Leishmania tarentolae]|uniref:Unspecified product n=1 Tax=Leishmania tarentolae TaxID=5689 RepID=A0A640KQ45_LEITA|nr:unspecified product [Leishmania tarentolae]